MKAAARRAASVASSYLFRSSARAASDGDGWLTPFLAARCRAWISGRNLAIILLVTSSCRDWECGCFPRVSDITIIDSHDQCHGFQSHKPDNWMDDSNLEFLVRPAERRVVRYQDLCAGRPLRNERERLGKPRDNDASHGSPDGPHAIHSGPENDFPIGFGITFRVAGSCRY